MFFHRFLEVEANEAKVIEDTMWVLHGLLANTGAAYSPCK